MDKPKTKSAQGADQVSLKGGNLTLKKGYIKERNSTHLVTHLTQVRSTIARKRESKWTTKKRHRSLSLSKILFSCLASI